MCFKKWFDKPDPVIPLPLLDLKKRALLFAINNYAGSGNDLNGCLNDQRDVADKLNKLFPGEFDIKKFSDSQVTADCYKSEVAKAIAQLGQGATVIVMADSCFSGTITKAFFMGFGEELHPTKNRFYQNPDLPIRNRVNVQFAKADTTPMRWITISGCGEEQTSADAYINGEYHGAFTFYAMLSLLTTTMTYRQWHQEIRAHLPNKSFNQIPGLEGPDNLLDRVVFDGEVLLIHNSSHGTQTYDKEGDEADGYDEAIYLYDEMITDDEINALLQKIL